MPFKNQDLGWIRVNFKREADKALRDFMSKTKLAPVDWYEDLDEETKEAYNKNVLDKTANTYSAIYKFSPEEEQAYRDRFDIDYTAYIKDPIAANELHKAIMKFIQELIGDYRWSDWTEKMGLNENIDQRKIKSWALFSDSILEKVYQKVTKEEDLDYLWNQMSRKAVSDDQQFAIDYFYNYRKMELGLPYNKELIGNMELDKTTEQLKEAAIGFKPDATGQARSSIETMMGNLDQVMDYLQGNAFVKTYESGDASKIKELVNKVGDDLNDLLSIVHSTPDTKAKSMGLKQEIRLKNYKPLGEEMDLDKTWADTFGDRAQKLADKQRDFAMGVKYRVEYTTQDGEKAKSRVYSSKEEADKKEADLVNSGIKQAKVVKVEESINEEVTQKQIDDIENSGNIDIAYKKAMTLLRSLMKKSINEETLKGAIEKEMKANAGRFETPFPTRDLRQILNTKNPEDLPNSAKKVLDKLKKKYKIEESINEVKVDYDFSERELIRVLQKLKRGASGERGMIQAFIKALGRDITRDELFPPSINEGFTKGQKVTYLGHPGVITGVYDRGGKKIEGDEVPHFVSVSYDKGIGKTKAYMILATDGTVKPVNENIETLLSPEDLKYYRAHREEIEDILNAEWRSSKLSAKDAVEKHKALNEDKKYKRGDKLKIKLKNGKEFDLNFDSYSRQSGVAFGKFKDEDGDYTKTKPFSLDAIIDEGTCGYNTDAKTGKKFKTPGGLEERIKTLVKKTLNENYLDSIENWKFENGWGFIEDYRREDENGVNKKIAFLSYNSGGREDLSKGQSLNVGLLDNLEKNLGQRFVNQLKGDYLPLAKKITKNDILKSGVDLVVIVNHDVDDIVIKEI